MSPVVFFDYALRVGLVVTIAILVCFLWSYMKENKILRKSLSEAKRK